MLVLLAGALALIGIGLGHRLRRAVSPQPAQRLAQLLDDHTMVSEVDHQQRFTYANRMFCELSGYGLDELLEREDSLTHSDRHMPDFWREMQRVVNETGVWRGEVCNRAKDGRLYWTDTTVLGVRGKHGEIETRIRLCTDITARKQAELALSESVVQLTVERDLARDAERVKAEFLATMSHEIRTPLNAVIGFSNLLSDTSLTEEQAEFVRTVRTSAESLLCVINDILDFSKIEADKLTIEQVPFDLVTVAEDVAELLSTQADIKSLDLVIECEADAPTLLVGDPVRVRQVLINLAGNAVKFTSAGYVRIAIRSTRDPASGLAVPLVEISDTGIGIPPEKLSSLFQRFSQVDASTTRKFGGTGLGLAISRRLVEMMGGETGVRSQPGHGSVFWFTLGSSKLDVAAHEPVPEALLSTTALVITASDAIGGTLSNWLSERGLRCVRSETIDQTIEALESAKQSGTVVRTLIIDRLLPDGTAEQLAQRAAPLLADQPHALIVLVRPSEHAEIPPGVFDALVLKPLARRTSLQKALLQAVRANDPSAVVEPKPGSALSTSRATPQPDSAIVRHVLVAEDNLINQRLAAHLLRKFGCELVFASNGLEVVEAARRTRFDLILMDCQMPEMDGFEATAEIRRCETRGDRVPIVALTANAMQGDRERCLAAGMDDYLTKPIRPEELRAMLERWATAGAVTA